MVTLSRCLTCPRSGRGWERARWEPLPSRGMPGWDGDVSEGGPVSLSVHQCLVGPGGGEAGCAKGKAVYKEGGKYEGLKAI